jgi:hypothetical protein
MRLLLLVSLIALPGLLHHASAQGNIRDTTIALTVVSAGYAYQLPGGDMAMRFGANSNINLHAAHKFRSNYLLGVEGGFIFGDKVREPGLLRNMINREGQIVDQEGQMADVLLYLLMLSEQLGIDPVEAAWRKLRINEARYPVDKARGVSTKYSDL